MKTRSVFIIACCVLAVIPSFAQINISSQKITGPPFWKLSGNSGTNPSKNFIGTRDEQPLVFKVNNQKAGLIDFSDFNQNTSFGYQTLNSNIVSDNGDGTFLSAFGWGALSHNTTGLNNTAHGAGSLFSNTTGLGNTGIGHFALVSNTTGSVNTAIGGFSLASNTTGEANTAEGDFALVSNTTGIANVATGGSFTLTSNTEGSFNIGTGVVALTANTTGNANVAYGSYSLATNVTGNKNTTLGDHTDVTAGNLHNATAIGNHALVDASNKVRIGNNAVTSIGGAVGWTNYSDERIKDNVKENVPGLEFIKALRPVTYHFNVAKENALLGVKDISTNNITMPQLKGIKLPNGKEMKMPTIKDIANLQLKNISAEDNAIEKIQFTGFIAQDVDKAAKRIGYDFSGIDKSGNIMGLRYSDFVVPLVKAIQELSKQNEDLQKQIDELKAMMSSSSSNSKHIILSNASLEQNAPNPFSNTTTITYNLPEKFEKAQIVVADKNGKTLRQGNIFGQGKGTITIDATMLAAGTYNYSLIVDRKVISSKQMVLIK
jgi:hypothetical protein